MNAIRSRSTVKSRVLGWLVPLSLPLLALLFYTVSVGVAMIMVFTVLLVVVVLASVVLIRSKLAFQRRERDLLSTGISQ